MVRYLPLLGLIFFFFPFVTVSCMNQPVMSLSGIQYITGTAMPEEIRGMADSLKELGGDKSASKTKKKKGSAEAKSADERIPPNPFIIAAAAPPSCLRYGRS